MGRLLADLDGLASPDRIVRVRPAGALPIAECAALAAAVGERKPRFAALQYDPIDLRPIADEDADLLYDPVIREVSIAGNSRKPPGPRSCSRTPLTADRPTL